MVYRSQFTRRSNPQRRHYHTPESFKERFKVGDKICGFTTCINVVITAIGETRFLYKYNDEEKVGKMTCRGSRWREVGIK